MKARHNFLPRHAQIFHFARHATFRAAGLKPEVAASPHRIVRQRPLGRRVTAQHNFFARHAMLRAVGSKPALACAPFISARLALFLLKQLGR
jgi:hypothetical protein